MKSTRLLLALLSVLVAADPAAASVDPLLRHLARHGETPELARPDASQTIVRVLVHGTSALTRGAVEAIPGARVGSLEGGLATVRLPLAAVDELAARDGVVHVQAARVLTAQLERLAPNVRLDELRNDTPTWTGRGALVGIVDTGVDVLHRDLRTAEGATRVTAIWDLDATEGTPPPGFAEGRYVTRAEIDAALDAGTPPPHLDTSGHGTHLAGVAIGNGIESLGTRRGVATEAELAVVAVDELTEDRIVDGLRFLMEEARRQSRPLVVVLAVGTHFGAHDGTSALEREIERLDGRGVTVVLPAGNSGDLRQHTTVAVQDTVSRFTVSDYVASPEPGDFGLLDFWFDTPPTVVFGGEVVVEPGQIVDFALPSGTLYIDNASQGPDPRNGDYNVVLILDDSDGTDPVVGAEFDVEFVADDVGHGWFAAGNVPLWFTEASGRTGEYTVTIPATGRGGIAVGATRSRAFFASAGGSVAFGPPPTVLPTGARVPYSSKGPTRDGRRKPDLVAPGSFFVAPLATNLAGDFDDFLVDTDRHYVVAEGTSQAAAVVAGVVALMYEKNPNLSAARVRQLLLASATTDDVSGPTWNAEYGAGALDALRAVRTVRRPVAIGGDVDGDGRTTVGDVVALARHVVDPAGRPLGTDARAAADLAPLPEGDGVLDVRDVGLVLGVALDESDLARTGIGAVTARRGAPQRRGDGWGVPFEFRGTPFDALQFVVRSRAGLRGPVSARAASVYDHGDANRRHGLAFATAATTELTVWIPVDGPDTDVRMTRAHVADRRGFARAVAIEDAAAAPILAAVSGTPNPTVGPTTIRFTLSRSVDVSVVVYDLRGRRVREVQRGELGAGRHALVWDGRDATGRSVASGAYLLRVDADGSTVTRKIAIRR